MVGRRPLEANILGSSPSPATLLDKSGKARSTVHFRRDETSLLHSIYIIFGKMQVYTYNQLVENTHCNFDGEKVIVSSNLRIIVSFLQEIEKEIKTVLNYDKQLDLIRKQHLETIELLSVLGKKLKDNSIDFKFTLSEPPDTFAEKIKIERPTRAEMIMLFANLEVLFCLTLAYENKIVDKVEIIKKAMNQKLIIDFF